MSNMDLEELIATRELNGLNDGMYEDERLNEYLTIYNDLEGNRNYIDKIEPAFFFEMVGDILKDYKRCLKREDNKKNYLTQRERQDLNDYADLMRKEDRYYSNLIKKALEAIYR